jgi:endonuclease YncB( thermonuclease family)
VLLLKNNPNYKKRNHKLKFLKSRALYLIIISIILLGFLGKTIQREQNTENVDNDKILSSNNYNFSGTVDKVRDGDTIIVNNTPIRLSGVTCDEIGSPLGDKAKLFLKAKISSKNARCFLNGEKSYDRTIGKCVVEDFGDVGVFMIKSKLCGRCPRYDKEEIYLGLQNSIGMFVGKMPNYCKL